MQSSHAATAVDIAFDDPNLMAQAAADTGDRTDRLTSAEKKELAELRRRNRQLEMENDILKRAAAYFARENVLPK